MSYCKGLTKQWKKLGRHTFNNSHQCEKNPKYTDPGMRDAMILGKELQDKLIRLRYGIGKGNKASIPKHHMYRLK